MELFLATVARTSDHHTPIICQITGTVLVRCSKKIVHIIEILERFQWKTLRMIVDAPWYVPNTVIQRDLQTPTVKEETQRCRSQYSARLNAHPNDLTANLMELPDNR
jgi:hypothetical protein